MHREEVEYVILEKMTYPPMGHNVRTFDNQRIKVSVPFPKGILSFVLSQLGLQRCGVLLLNHLIHIFICL